METIELKGKRRKEHGTRTSRKLRDLGRLPAVIYGHGEKPETITLDRHDVEVGLAHGARTMQVDINGKKGQYLIKEVQYDHLDQTPIHLDLTRVNLNERVTVNIGIELRGTPKGSHEGGILDQHLADIEVECLVSQIPQTFHPLVNELAVGDSLLVKDLELPAGVTVLADAEERICTVRAKAIAVEEEEEETPESEEETSGEPERIGRVRKDEEESGADKGKG